MAVDKKDLDLEPADGDATVDDSGPLDLSDPAELERRRLRRRRAGLRVPSDVVPRPQAASVPAPPASPRPPSAADEPTEVQARPKTEVDIDIDVDEAAPVAIPTAQGKQNGSGPIARYATPDEHAIEALSQPVYAATAGGETEILAEEDLQEDDEVPVDTITETDAEDHGEDVNLSGPDTAA